MELAHGQHGPPPRRGPARGGSQRILEDQQGRGVEQAQHGADDQLRVSEPDEGDDGLAEPREDHGPDKGAGHGAREGEVVVGLLEAAGDVGRRRAVYEDVVRGLEVERLLDLGVWGEQQVGERYDEEEGVYEQVCRRDNKSVSCLCGLVYQCELSRWLFPLCVGWR